MTPEMVLHRYRDYAEYVAVQTAGNARKLDHRWVREATVVFLANYLRGYHAEDDNWPTFGLCHGTRGGYEQSWFRRELPGCDVIGTEIAPTATQFPHTIQWDFHETQPEWIGRADFIYSNSFDHAYDPAKALRAWVSCLTPAGLCFLEHTWEHGPEGVTELDPFGVTQVALMTLVETWTDGRYAVCDVLAPPRRRGEKFRTSAVLVIARQEGA